MTTTNHTNPSARVEHRMERTYEVAATPEQVWEAIATADGMSAWMMPTQLDPTVGGVISLDQGGDFRSTGVVTAYEPNRRIAYDVPWPLTERPEDVPADMVTWFDSIGASLEDVYRDLPSITPLATEFIVESASGGSSVIRVVSSSYGIGADWENEFFTEMIAGWSEMLDNLAKHLDDLATQGADR